MVWGAAGPPEGPAGSHVARAEAHQAAHMPDKDAIRTAQQMREAGLKWRPSMVPSIAWVVVGLVVASVLYVYLR